MKKKIKDFTIGELQTICDSRECCEGCPIRKICNEDILTIISTEDLDEEIEVEEDKPQKCKDLRGLC